MTPGTSFHEETLQRELDALGLAPLLADPDLTDVMVNPDGTVFTLGYKGATLHPDPVPAGKLTSCIATIAGINGRVVDAKNPLLEVTLPFSRVRVTAVVPPITTGPLLALRIPPRRLLTLEDLLELGSLTPESRDLLTTSILQGETMVIAGAVGAGKTVLATALLAHLLAVEPTERLLIIEEGAREIRLPEKGNVLRLLSPSLAEHSIRSLLRISLRLNPDRIIVGELRGAEALDMLKAALSGHPGLATLHANTAPDALARLTDLLEEAGSPPSPSRVARSVRLIVHVARVRARRRVQEILRLSPPDAAGDFEMRTLYTAP